LKQRFWWTKIKIKIARYVARCDTCRKVKAVHLKSAGMLQPLSIPSWKWEDISMDFITGLLWQNLLNNMAHMCTTELKKSVGCPRETRIIHEQDHISEALQYYNSLYNKLHQSTKAEVLHNISTQTRCSKLTKLKFSVTTIIVE
jgi:hypothetical protein